MAAPPCYSLENGFKIALAHRCSMIQRRFGLDVPIVGDVPGSNPTVDIALELSEWFTTNAKNAATVWLWLGPNTTEHWTPRNRSCYLGSNRRPPGSKRVGSTITPKEPFLSQYCSVCQETLHLKNCIRPSINIWRFTDFFVIFLPYAIEFTSPQDSRQTKGWSSFRKKWYFLMTFRQILQFKTQN
jgi:hypothetical protein